MAFVNEVRLCQPCVGLCKYDETFYLQHLKTLMKSTPLYVSVLRTPISGMQAPPPPYTPYAQGAQPAYNPYFQPQQGACYPPPYGGGAGGGFNPAFGQVPPQPMTANPILFRCQVSPNERFLLFSPDASGPYNYVENLQPLDLTKILARTPITDDYKNVVSILLKFRELKAIGEEDVEMILTAPQDPAHRKIAVQWLNGLSIGLNMIFNKK